MSCTRSVDTVGRYGGDEFVFVLPNLRHADQVQPVLRRVRNAFDQPFKIGKRRLQVSTSIGVAIYPADGQEPGELLRFADQQMYRQKQQRNDDTSPAKPHFAVVSRFRRVLAAAHAG